MALDLAARGMAAAGIARQKRMRTLHALGASMARAALQPLALSATVPTIGAPTAASAIATGTTWNAVSNNLPVHASKYTFLAANWKNPSPTTFPNSEFWKPECVHGGNGSDPAANPGYAGRVRFTIDAPQLELFVQCAQTGTGAGFRLKVDGQYVSPGPVGLDATNGALRYILLTWGDGSAANRKMRNYELEFFAIGGFWGVRCANLYKPQPWPQPDGLRVLVHGDSMTNTVVDSGNKDLFLTPPNGVLLADLLGQADTWCSGVGGSGWFAPAAHTSNWFNDRVAIDVVANAPDVVIEIGGGNDESQLTAGAITISQYQTAVESWLAAVLAAKPETLVFMFAPVITNAAPALGHVRARDAKAAAAAKWPRNVTFIDWYSDMWFTGTGRQTATVGDGNRDWALGSDNAHPTAEGSRYLAGRIARAIAGAIPALISAQN